jgi:hypothetical protein
MRNPKFWPVTSRVDGSPIAYGAPVEIGPAVSAQVSFDIADNPDYGDDVIVDNDKGINGYSVVLETNDIAKAARAACLGWKAISSGTPAAVTHYEVTDSEPPEGGLSFIRVKMFKEVRSYEAFFFHALEFSSGGENASTKQKQITWNHPTMNGTGKGVYIDSTGDAHYFNWMEFETQAAAEAWINAQGGYTPPANNG